MGVSALLSWPWGRGTWKQGPLGVRCPGRCLEGQVVVRGGTDGGDGVAA